MTAIDEANRNAFDSGGMQGDGDHVSRFERSLVPTCLGENARTVQLATPVRNGAFGALHIKVDLSMRIRPGPTPAQSFGLGRTGGRPDSKTSPAGSQRQV